MVVEEAQCHELLIVCAVFAESNGIQTAGTPVHPRHVKLVQDVAPKKDIYKVPTIWVPTSIPIVVSNNN